MNEQEYFAEQSRKRLADLGIEPGPRQPLEEKDAEIARLHHMLAYVARCLSLSEFCVNDRTYLESIARYITERISPVELSDEYVSGQNMERIYDAVQAQLDSEE